MPKPTPPSPPARAGTEGREARVHPRYDLFASVELHHAQETLVLPARNISLGGLYIAADGNDLSALEIGVVVEVMLFDAADEGQPTVRSDATVVRRERDGLALSWASTDPVLANKLAVLLERLRRTP